MHLICTTQGTARLMSEDEKLQDLNIGIYDIYQLLTRNQQDDLYNWAKTEVTDVQETQIRQLAGA